MKKSLLHLFVFATLVGLVNKSFAQRYTSDVFPAVTKTANIEYDSNRAINLIPPNSPPIITTRLYCDIYEPAGDTFCKRPLVIVPHTGSYLPPIVNQQVTGSKDDSATVELCRRLAMRGFVAVAMNYRLGWNPQTTVTADAQEQLIKATYRALQDVRNCIRFMRKHAGMYRVDTSKIIVGGQGTGGYVSLALGAINKRAEIESNPKFQRGDFTPMISVDTLGDWMGNGGHPFFNYGGEPNIASDAHMVFNFGGAMGDSTWLDSMSLPFVSINCIKDPFAPFRTGNVVVPTTGITVINSASGGGAIAPYANSFGINNKINARTYSDPISNQALVWGGSKTLFPIMTLTPESAPWEWWDRTLMQSINFPAPGAGRRADSLSMLTNPFMSAARGKAYVDTVVRFVIPRIVAQFDLDAPSAIDTLSPFTSVMPTPGVNIVLTADSTKTINFNWNPSCGAFPSWGAVTYTWKLMNGTGATVMTLSSNTATTLNVNEKALDNALATAGIAAGATMTGNWQVTAMQGSSLKGSNVSSISIQRPAVGAVHNVYGSRNISLYPNPATSSVNIRMENTGVSMDGVAIMDLSGKVIMSASDIHADTYNMNLSSLSKGLYLVKVNLENGASLTKQLIVE